jgi:hypothetical protein
MGKKLIGIRVNTCQATIQMCIAPPVLKPAFDETFKMTHPIEQRAWVIGERSSSTSAKR